MLMLQPCILCISSYQNLCHHFTCGPTRMPSSFLFFIAVQVSNRQDDARWFLTTHHIKTKSGGGRTVLLRKYRDVLFGRHGLSSHDS